MRVMLRSLIVAPQNRLIAEKFLFLTLEKAEGSAGRMLIPVAKATRTLPDDTGVELVDMVKFDEATVAFNGALSTMRKDRKFLKYLRLIRNTVAGHIVGDETGVRNGAIWVLPRQGISLDMDGVVRSQIVSCALMMLEALTGLARGLHGAFKV